MPCNRRMNHCGGNRHHPRFHPYHHGHPRFHPYIMMMHEAMNEAAAHQPSEEEEVVSALFGKDKTRWNESETEFVFQMDVPGVKAHQVTIEEKDGEIEVTAIRMNGEEVAKTYQDVFYLRPSKADLGNVLATLNEGVLKIVVPKKNEEPMEIVVEARNAPAAAADGKEFRVAMDLPGVKPADLKVHVLDDKIHVEASRMIGDRNIGMRRVVEVEPAKAEIAQARAFLQDGVFTLVAPVPEEAEEMSTAGALRTMYVQEEESAEDVVAFESLTLEDNKKEDKVGDMVVETVAEGDKDWEEVNENAKEEAKEKKIN